MQTAVLANTSHVGRLSRYHKPGGRAISLLAGRAVRTANRQQCRLRQRPKPATVCASQRLSHHGQPVLDAALTLLYPGRRLHEQQEAAAYFEMARMVNLLPSCVLVYLGAWIAGGRSLQALLSAKVALLSAIAGSIAVGSCVLNDFFDYSVDIINEPNKPLPRHAVPLEGALLLSFALYTSVLIAGCMLEPPALRAIIATSAAATLLYTPVLKRLTFVKNVAVASVIALTPLTGALALGQGPGVLAAVAGPCAALFCGILHREILMDLNDVDGDRENGVHTVPVVLGKRAALAAAAGLAAACVGAAGAVLALNAGRGFLAALSPTCQLLVRAAGGVLLCLGSAPLFGNVMSIVRRNFDSATVKNAIDSSMQSIGICLLVAASFA
ncbi:g7998 [Coccomyxa viridis]|uniref:G7998 protein n=1 Tax=Coccomyxa viridis TaxID=1274662 RepID=A0ABP1FZD5_9CHLO